MCDMRARVSVANAIDKKTIFVGDKKIQTRFFI